MDWFRAVNGYCERTDASYWSEPRERAVQPALPGRGGPRWQLAARAGDRGGQLLAAVLALIGIGSYLFHTHAQVWALFADVLPINVFILLYIDLATVRFFGAARWAGAAGGRRLRPYARAGGARRSRRRSGR